MNIPRHRKGNTKGIHILSMCRIEKVQTTWGRDLGLLENVW